MNVNDEEEFEELRKKAKAYASQSKRGINSPRFDSSDIAQLSCIQIWQAWQDVEKAGIGDLVINDTFLKKVCHGKTSNLLRFHASQKRSVAKETSQDEQADASNNTPLANAEKNEQRRLLLAAMAKLSDEYRRLVIMRYQLSMTLEEIANSMSKSVDWVHRHLKKSLSELSACMSAS